MEMCYDGVLVMPSSYAVMSEDEMTYVEGGAWNGNTFKKNIMGVYNAYKDVRNALRGGGLTVGAIASTAAMTVSSIVTYYGITITKTALIIGGIVGAVIAVSAITAGVYYLGTHRVWY